MSRADYLASLRAERHEDVRNELLTQRVEAEQRYRDASQRAADFVALGDRENAKYFDQDMEAIEQEVAQIDAQLDQFDRAQMPADGLTDAERQYIQQNPEIANAPGVDTVAAYYSNYMTSLGYDRNSPEYIEGMKTVLEPEGYEKPWTPNDVCEALGLDPDEYNKNVEKLHRLKSLGEYPDR